MSTLFDVTAVSVIEAPVEVGSEATSLVITDGMTVPSVTISSPVDVELLTVEVPGQQGAPGLQNVYVQSTDPSKDSNGNTIWGQAQKNFIWIQI